MTRYIGEPSPEKKIAEGRALTESLARRPGPVNSLSWAGFSKTELAVAGTRDVAWDSFNTNDLTVFGTAATNGGAQTNVTGNKFLRVKQAGIYFMAASARWVTDAIGQAIDITGYDHDPLVDYTDTAETTASALGQDNLVEGWFVAHSATPVGYFKVLVAGGAGSDVILDWAIFYWPAVDFEVVY